MDTTCTKAGGGDPKPPMPSDPANAPPIEEPTDVPPEREEPDGEDGRTPSDPPVIA